MNTTNDYWELTEQERAALSEEQMDSFVAFELMRAGVIPAKLELVDEPEMPEPDGQVFRLRIGYRSDEIAYPTIEAARDAAAGGIGTVEQQGFGDYPNRINISMVKPFEDDRSELIERVPVYSPEHMAKVRAEVEKAAAARAENAKRRQVYDKALEAQKKALQGMWEDWHGCRAQAARAAEVQNTYAEYKRLTDGNEDVALTFLAKAYGQERINEAMAWSAEAAQ